MRLVTKPTTVADLIKYLSDKDPNTLIFYQDKDSFNDDINTFYHLIPRSGFILTDNFNSDKTFIDGDYFRDYKEFETYAAPAIIFNAADWKESPNDERRDFKYYHDLHFIKKYALKWRRFKSKF